MPITKKRRMLNAQHPNKGAHNDDGNENWPDWCKPKYQENKKSDRSGKLLYNKIDELNIRAGF